MSVLRLISDVPGQGDARPLGASASVAGASRETMGTVVRLRRQIDAPLPSAAHAGSRAADALAASALGDEQAFAVFYDEVSPVVYGTVLRVIRNPAMAEEVTQDVFLELWRQAPRYDAGKGSPKSWAATIAHRRAVDRVRSVESSRARDEVDARQAPRDHDVVAEAVATSLDRTRVVAALNKLTDVQREAVSLAYYGGHTYREVAVMLGVPEGTIKTRIRDGLSTLRELMGVSS